MFGPVALSDAAIILPERHIQRPVQAILDAPVASDRVGEPAWVLAVEAGDVLGGSLAGDQALTLHTNDRAQARPIVTLLDPVDLIGAPQPPSLDPAGVFLDRLVIAMIDARLAVRAADDRTHRQRQHVCEQVPLAEMRSGIGSILEVFRD